jgi:diaminopimelate epimerase
VRFVKAHGCGNDFILVAASLAPAATGEWARLLCDRHTGIGGDGLILFEPASDGVGMRLLNADGGEAEISGNGLRCLAALAVRTGLAAPDHLVHTAAGSRRVEVRQVGDARYRISTRMGMPRFRSDEVPMALDPPSPTVVGYPVLIGGAEWRITALSMGNPHCSILLDQPADDALLRHLGAALETHPLFPRRTNVELVSITGPGEVRARFWERGVGPTLASGTGAASAAVAAILSGRVGRSVRVVCDGGVLEVEWPEHGEVLQTGEVEVLFEGFWLAGSNSAASPAASPA